MAAVLKEQVIAADVACDTRWDGYEWGSLALGHGLRACWSTPITSSGGAILGTFAVYWRQPGSPATAHQTIIERMTHLAAVAIERERSESALNEVRSEMAHVARVATLGEMTASIAHEINQPLGAIVNNANASLRWLAAKNAEEAQQSVALIVADGHRASEILARIRAMVQKSPLQRHLLDLNDAIREVVTLVGSQAEKHGVSIESRLSDGIPSVRADRVQMQQVVLNLVMNAIEAMAGTPDGLRRITVGSRHLEDTTVLVSVCDRGPGFNPHHVERLFEAFYSTKPAGLGMGLAISRGIVTAHDGRLWATSNADRGATFQFTLPIAPGDGS
jgi:C4-dicarboxylate-specific signal transduction histidine kinase